MKKQFIIGYIAGAVTFGAIGALAAGIIANPNPFPIQLNGSEVSIEGYNIEGSTYFKLRDIADAVGGFNVGFNNNTIQLSKDGYVYEDANLKSTFANYAPEELRKLNVFFSNFCEAFLYTYNPENINQDKMISFAYIHHFINHTGRDFTGKIDNPYFQYVCMGIPSDAFDDTIYKYFGITLPHEGTVYQLSNGLYSGWAYQDGKFFTAGASGESYDRFSIVTDIFKMHDDTFLVYLNTYQLPLDRMNPVHNPPDYYAYSAQTAANDPECTLMFKQTALIAPHEYNDTQTWKLFDLSIAEAFNGYDTSGIYIGIAE